jgi:hypothetical protein
MWKLIERREILQKASEFPTFIQLWSTPFRRCQLLALNSNRLSLPAYSDICCIISETDGYLHSLVICPNLQTTMWHALHCAYKSCISRHASHLWIAHNALENFQRLSFHPPCCCLGFPSQNITLWPVARQVPATSTSCRNRRSTMSNRSPWPRRRRSLSPCILRERHRTSHLYLQTS